MELSIIKQLKQTLYKLRRKPSPQKSMRIVEKVKPSKPIKAKPIEKKHTVVLINGVEMTLSQIAEQYNLKLSTVLARYRVGNKGRLLIRPVNRIPKDDLTNLP